MPVIARVVIIDRDADAGTALALMLKARGFGTEVLSVVDHPEEIARVTADIALVQDRDAEAVIRGFRSQPNANDLIWIAVGPEAAIAADTVLSHGFSEHELSVRVDSAARIVTMRNELHRRGKITALYGGEAPPIPTLLAEIEAPRLLFIGDHDGDAANLAAKLGHGAQFTVVADGYAALERLQSQIFDGIIVPDSQDGDAIISFAEDLRRNPRLFHIPLFALVNLDGQLTEQRYYAAGVSQIFRRPVDDTALRGLVVGLIKLYLYRLALMKAHRQVRHPATTDALTQHYTFGFLMTSLSAQIGAALQGNKNLSIGLIEVSNISALNERLGYVAGDRILRQVAGLIANLVRGEDLVARQTGATFAIVLPDTPPEIAQRVIGRVASVVAYTEYALPGLDDPTYAELRVGNAHVEPGDTAEILVARALAALR